MALTDITPATEVEVLARGMRRLGGTAIIAAFGYSLVAGTRGACDREQCVMVQVGPNTLIYVVLALVVFFSIRPLARRAEDPSAAATTTLRRGAVIVTIAFGSATIGLLWLFLSPMTAFTDTIVGIPLFVDLTVTVDPIGPDGS
jgi:fucose 4-O-acetylase-like acetyltransferase